MTLNLRWKMTLPKNLDHVGIISRGRCWGKIDTAHAVVSNITRTLGAWLTDWCQFSNSLWMSREILHEPPKNHLKKRQVFWIIGGGSNCSPLGRKLLGGLRIDQCTLGAQLI